jgi:hypothetical protein
MHMLRVSGVLCVPLVCYFSTVGVYYHVRFHSGINLAINNKTLLVVSLITGTALVTLMMVAMFLEGRSRSGRSR